MADGYALVGHAFENVSVAGVLNCYQTCQPNCRCISFNFLTNVQQDNCQLNEENRHLKPGALMPLRGSQYYDVVIDYSVKTASSSSPCTQCYNRCCRDQPCLNGGTCRENCEAAEKRFICYCPAGFTGQLCENCQEGALGMESGAIADGQISASSEYGVGVSAIQARLNLKSNIKRGGWEPAIKNVHQWLQIDLLKQNTRVKGVATQGRNDNYHRVTKYKLQYSNDAVTFQYYKEQGQSQDKLSPPKCQLTYPNQVFAGNTDSDTVVYHDLNPPITARYIRFRPVTWNFQIAMRVELYHGCPGVRKQPGFKKTRTIPFKFFSVKDFY
ncbi:hypothetical protein ACROYT_G004096 [Oculina patagonica]